MTQNRLHFRISIPCCGAQRLHSCYRSLPLLFTSSIGFPPATSEALPYPPPEWATQFPIPPSRSASESHGSVPNILCQPPPHFRTTSSDIKSTYMVHNLVRDPPIVLQEIIILQTLRNSNLLRYGEHLGELVVGDVVEFRAVEFGDDELQKCQLLHEHSDGAIKGTRQRTTYRMAFAERTNIEESEGFLALKDLQGRDLAWSLLACSMSPSLNCCTPDDLAEDTGRHYLR